MKLSDVDMFYRIESFRKDYREKNGHDMEIRISTDCGYWEVVLAMEGWAAELGDGRSHSSLEDAWELAVYSMWRD